MKYFRYPILLLIIFQFFSAGAYAQLFPGIRVNGRIINQGDTINVCLGSSLFYQSSATGANATTWKLDLGTPNTFSGPNPGSVTYSTVGIDSTIQYISSGAGRDSLYIIIRVTNVRPVANYSFTPDNVCGNIPISFTNSSAGAQNVYQWNFGDNTTSSITSPQHQFLSAVAPPNGSEIFSVKLIATNQFGCKDSVTKQVTIKRTPDASVGNADPDVIYIQQTSTFKVCTNIPSYIFKFINQSATIANNVNYTITWGDGTPDSTFTSWPVAGIIEHPYTIGSKTLTVKVTGPDGCIGIKNYTIFLGTNPAGGFNSPGNSDICAPDSLPFIISGYQNNSPGTIYRITINDGTPPQIFTHPPPDSVTHYFTYSSCGTVSSNGTVQFDNSFSATLNIENPCALTSVSVIPIYVSSKPKAQILVNPSNTVCVNSNVFIQSSSLYGGVVTATGNGNSSCSNGGKQVWSISPATGYTLLSGSLGSLNGSPGNGLLWTTGTTFLNVNFSTPGTYTVKLYVFNERCGSDSAIQTICVRNPPLASFTMSNKSACLSGTTVITNTSPNGLCLGDKYDWTVTYLDPLGCGSAGNNYSFINGTAATSMSPELQFTAPGKYVIRLITTAIGTNFSCPTATKTDTFTVKGRPKVTIDPINSICSNNTIAPTAAISGCYNDSLLIYSWTFTNGTPANSPLAVPGLINYIILGSNPVQLSVSNECGITTDQSSVSVIAPPTANAGPDKEFCSSSGIGIGTSGVAGINYQWSPSTGLNNASIATPLLNLIYTGNNTDTVYTYELTASAGANCSSKDTVLVRVKKRPTILLNPLTADICAGLNVQLTAGGATSYSWSPSASLNSSTGDTVVATPPATTTYEVAGVGPNGCADTASVTVNIKQYPVVDAGNDSLVCNNTPAIQFTGQPAGGAWSGTNISASGLFNPQLSGNGIYTLKYTTALNLCSKADSIIVTVIDPPAANAGADTTVCQDSNGIITLVGTPAGGNWSGSSLVTASGVFSPSTGGSYTLIYTFGAGSCIDQDTIVINVTGAITNNIISSNQSVCINTLPAVITGQAAVGGNGTPAYQWQMSADSINWINISGETGLNYAPPVLTETTFFRRVATTILCGGAQGNTSVPVKITIRRDAEAIFTADPSTSCSPFDLQNAITVSPFSDRNGLYEWYADGILIGSNTDGTFPGYTIQNPADTVLIKLKTSSQYGCKPDSTEQQFITVITALAKFSKHTSSGCGPLPVTFTNTSSLLNGIQFSWDFGNGERSDLAQPGQVIFNSSPFFSDTTYQVILRAYNGCDTTIWRDSVKVRSNPKARFGVDTTFGCSPFTIHISNTSPGGADNYYWDFGDGTRDTTLDNGSLNHTYNIGNAVDTVTIRLIAENQCARDTQSIDIRIAPNPIRPLINVGSSELFGCISHTVSFNNNTSGATGYNWDFGDNTPPVITNNDQSIVQHTYDSAGVFTVAVNITNGCSDTTVFRQVTVYARPSAAFVTDATVYCAGDTVRVVNSSQDATNYRWFWGDGSTSTDSEPYHVFTVSGNYNILLRAERTNNAGLVCIDTLVRPVAVLGKPVVTVQSNVNEINCAPFTLNVSAPGIINEDITWYFYDSTVTPSIITTKNITAQYTFNKPGSFYLKMIAVNAAGCTDSTTIPFTIRGKAVASFTPADLAVCTSDTTISYINTTTYDGTDPISYRWLVDNALVSTGGNFTHRYNVLPGAVLPKVFNTMLIVSNTVGCIDTASALLQMNPPAKAQFSITNPNECAPFKISIVDASLYTTSYKWLVNGTTVSNDADPGIVITQGSALYTISLIADNIYGCKPDTFNVSFTSRAKPAASFIVSDTLGCSGELNVATTNLTTGASGYTWNWGDTSANSSFKNPTHLYLTEGEYLITLIASDGVCTDTTEQAVKISVKPVVDFAVDQTVTCGSASVHFTNLTNTTNRSDYIWSFGNGTFSTEVEPSKSYAPRAAPYTVKLVASSNFGCKDSAVKANLVLAKVAPASDFFISPSPVITVPNYTFNFNNLTISSTNYKYLWSLGDGSFATTRDVSHKYVDTGNYTISLIVLDTATNCTDTTIKVARIDGFPGYLYVPNAICPQCIQTNLREFLPKGMGLKEYRLQIFTTWNELVFETSLLDSKGTPTQAWDARFKGAIVQQDVYVWRIDAKFLNGSDWPGMIYPGEGKYKKVGTITVIK